MLADLSRFPAIYVADYDRAYALIPADKLPKKERDALYKELKEYVERWRRADAANEASGL